MGDTTSTLLFGFAVALPSAAAAWWMLRRAAARRMALVPAKVPMRRRGGAGDPGRRGL